MRGVLKSRPPKEPLLAALISALKRELTPSALRASVNLFVGIMAKGAMRLSAFRFAPGYWFVPAIVSGVCVRVQAHNITEVVHKLVHLCHFRTKRKGCSLMPFAATNPLQI